MKRLDRTKFDLTKTNDAIDRTLAATTNPRHRFLLLTYYRHRFLEIGGRYQEIFAPEMTVENPVYHFNYTGIVTTLTGQDQIKGLYDYWMKTNQSIFYVISEQVAVTDNYVMSVAGEAYQQVHGSALVEKGVAIDDPEAYYLHRTEGVRQIWPYDDQGRMIGEDVWETQPELSELIKLHPDDVVTSAQAGALLAPFIKPLPSFADMVLQAA